MPPKKSNLSSRTSNARKLKRMASNRTEEEWEVVRASDRLRSRQRVNVESAESRAARLEDQRLRSRQMRAAETDLVRSQWNERERVRIAEARVQIAAHNHLQYNRLAFRYDPAVDYSSSPHVVIGKMRHVCTYYQALKFNDEAKGMCCAGGKVKLDQLETPPEPQVLQN